MPGTRHFICCHRLVPRNLFEITILLGEDAFGIDPSTSRYAPVHRNGRLAGTFRSRTVRGSCRVDPAGHVFAGIGTGRYRVDRCRAHEHVRRRRGRVCVASSDTARPSQKGGCRGVLDVTWQVHVLKAAVCRSVDSAKGDTDIS